MNADTDVIANEIQDDTSIDAIRNVWDDLSTDHKIMLIERAAEYAEGN